MSSKLYTHIRKLSNIFRFNGIHMAEPYNVAEHSLRVAVLGMIIADDYNKNRPKEDQVSVEEVLRKALIHDIEEGFFGDIPTPVKNYSKEFRAAYKTASQDYVKNHIMKGSPNEELYYSLWENDKGGLSGEIIKLADRIEALSAAGHEVRGGSHFMKEAHVSINKWFEGEEGKAALKKFPVVKEIYEDAVNTKEVPYKEIKKENSKKESIYRVADEVGTEENKAG